MNNIDNVIENVISKQIYEPINFEQAILTAFENKKQTKTHSNIIVRIITTIVAIITMTASIVFAKDIINVVKNFFAHNEGMDKAIANGYIENIDMEYVESNNINIKADRVLMDDNNLSIEMSVKLDSKVNNENIEKEEFKNLIVFDEQCNILYCENEDTFDNYCNKNNLQYSYNEFTNKYMNSGVNGFIKSKVEEEGVVKLIYNFYSNNYPKSKRVYINFDKVNIYVKENEKQKIIVTEGNWDLEIDMPEMFYNRTAVVYKVKDTTNDMIKLSEAVVYDTCMKIEMYTQEEPTYNEEDSEEVKQQKIHEKVEQWIEEQHKRIEKGDIDNLEIFYARPYIENQNNEKFYPTEGNFEDSGIIREYSGNIKYWQTFNITKADLTDELNLYIKYKGEDIYMTLIKK